MFPARLFILLIALLPGLAFAEAIPRGGPNDNRVRLATYQEGQVYRLSVSLTHVTTVEFGEGESIRSIIAGDTEGFEIDGVPGGQAFAIKPVARGVHTNVTVYMNRRSYYFNVEEVRSRAHLLWRQTCHLAAALPPRGNPRWSMGPYVRM